jgi:hypothetical protein
MRLIVAVMLVIFSFCGFNGPLQAQQSHSCKQCSEQRQACMKNYSGPTCKTEYDRCLKACKTK